MLLDDAIALAASNAAFVSRFFERTRKNGACLEWTGYRRTAKLPYGMVAVGGGRTAGAHRVAWTIAHGRIPHGVCVLHRCDNPSCVLEEHLFLGSIADNNADKARKGRAPRMCFEINGFSKLSKEDVVGILEAKRRGESNGSIGSRYGVSKEVVWGMLDRMRKDGRITHELHLAE